MTPEICLAHNDCVRACVASLLEMPSQQVPHFFADHNGENVDELNRKMHEWLAHRGYVAASLGLPGEWSQQEMLTYMRNVFTDRHYMLYCDSGGGDHAVIGYNDEIVHNPAWYKCAIDGPHSMGVWIIWIIAKL